MSEKDTHRREQGTRTSATSERAAGSAAGHVRAVTRSHVASIAILRPRVQAPLTSRRGQETKNTVIKDIYRVGLTP